MPTNLVRAALQDTASVAGFLVTTEAIVAEHPKKEPMPVMPGGGGTAGCLAISRIFASTSLSIWSIVKLAGSWLGG